MSLKITKAGIFDSIQDLGRWRHQHLGINPGGVMDRFSASLANALLGKELNRPVIELHFPASQILFQKTCIVCITGGDFMAAIDDVLLPLHQPVIIKTGTMLKWKALKNGARCYLSLLNDFQLEKWMGSFSTNAKAGAGGFNGRKLETRDELIFDDLHLPEPDESFLPLPWKYNDPLIQSNEVSVIRGNEWDWLTGKSKEEFLANSFMISFASDRMGYRLQGETLEQATREQLVSSAVSFGTVQLLPNGQLIILMADHQTTGGYPRIAHVTSADLPALAQKSPNNPIRFVMTDIASAEKKLVRQQQYLTTLQNTCNLKMQNWLHAR